MSAQAGERSAAVLLRQPDGTYRSVELGGRGPYTVTPPYPGAVWAPVYDSHGDRVGTVENRLEGSVFYDARGNRH